MVDFDDVVVEGVMRVSAVRVVVDTIDIAGEVWIIEEGGDLYELANTPPYDSEINDLLLSVSVGT